MCLFPNVTPAFLDSILTLLVPLFLTSAGDDLDAARHAAACMLASYDVETEAEIRLAAEIASRGFGVLDTLRRSMDPNLSISAVLRLRGSANAQHRSAHQCQQALDSLRTQRQRVASNTQPPATEPFPQDTATEPFPQDIAAEPLYQDTVADAGPLSSPATPAQPPVTAAPATLSRQQRRAMQRGLEKQQRRQAEQARRDEMRALRLNAKQTVPTGATPAEQAAAA